MSYHSRHPPSSSSSSSIWSSDELRILFHDSQSPFSLLSQSAAAKPIPLNTTQTAKTNRKLLITQSSTASTASSSSSSSSSVSSSLPHFPRVSPSSSVSPPRSVFSSLNKKPIRQAPPGDYFYVSNPESIPFSPQSRGRGSRLKARMQMKIELIDDQEEIKQEMINQTVNNQRTAKQSKQNYGASNFSYSTAFYPAASAPDSTVYRPGTAPVTSQSSHIHPASNSLHNTVPVPVDPSILSPPRPATSHSSLSQTPVTAPAGRLFHPLHSLSSTPDPEPRPISASSDRFFKFTAKPEKSYKISIQRRVPQVSKLHQSEAIPSNPAALVNSKEQAAQPPVSPSLTVSVPAELHIDPTSAAPISLSEDRHSFVFPAGIPRSAFPIFPPTVPLRLCPAVFEPRDDSFGFLGNPLADPAFEKAFFLVLSLLPPGQRPPTPSILIPNGQSNPAANPSAPASGSSRPSLSLDAPASVPSSVSSSSPDFLSHPCSNIPDRAYPSRLLDFYVPFDFASHYEKRFNDLFSSSGSSSYSSFSSAGSRGDYVMTPIQLEPPEWGVTILELPDAARPIVMQYLLSLVSQDATKPELLQKYQLYLTFTLERDLNPAWRSACDSEFGHESKDSLDSRTVKSPSSASVAHFYRSPETAAEYFSSRLLVLQGLFQAQAREIACQIECLHRGIVCEAVDLTDFIHSPLDQYRPILKHNKSGGPLSDKANEKSRFYSIALGNLSLPQFNIDLVLLVKELIEIKNSYSFTWNPKRKFIRNNLGQANTKELQKRLKAIPAAPASAASGSALMSSRIRENRDKSPSNQWLQISTQNAAASANGAKKFDFSPSSVNANPLVSPSHSASGSSVSSVSLAAALSDLRLFLSDSSRSFSSFLQKSLFHHEQHWTQHMNSQFHSIRKQFRTEIEKKEEKWRAMVEVRVAEMKNVENKLEAAERRMEIEKAEAERSKLELEQEKERLMEEKRGLEMESSRTKEELEVHRVKLLENHERLEANQRHKEELQDKLVELESKRVEYHRKYDEIALERSFLESTVSEMRGEIESLKGEMERQRMEMEQKWSELEENKTAWERAKEGEYQGKQEMMKRQLEEIELEKGRKMAEMSSLVDDLKGEMESIKREKELIEAKLMEEEVNHRRREEEMADQLERQKRQLDEEQQKEAEEAKRRQAMELEVEAAEQRRAMEEAKAALEKRIKDLEAERNALEKKRDEFERSKELEWREIQKAKEKFHGMKLASKLRRMSATSTRNSVFATAAERRNLEAKFEFQRNAGDAEADALTNLASPAAAVDDSWLYGSGSGPSSPLALNLATVAAAALAQSRASPRVEIPPNTGSIQPLSALVVDNGSERENPEPPVRSPHMADIHSNPLAELKSPLRTAELHKANYESLKKSQQLESKKLVVSKEEWAAMGKQERNVLELAIEQHLAHDERYKKLLGIKDPEKEREKEREREKHRSESSRASRAGSNRDDLMSPSTRSQNRRASSGATPRRRHSQSIDLQSGLPDFWLLLSVEADLVHFTSSILEIHAVRGSITEKLTESFPITSPPPTSKSAARLLPFSPLFVNVQSLVHMQLERDFIIRQAEFDRRNDGFQQRSTIGQVNCNLVSVQQNLNQPNPIENPIKKAKAIGTLYFRSASLYIDISYSFLHHPNAFRTFANSSNAADQNPPPTPSSGSPNFGPGSGPVSLSVPSSCRAFVVLQLALNNLKRPKKLFSTPRYDPVIEIFAAELWNHGNIQNGNGGGGGGNGSDREGHGSTKHTSSGKSSNKASSTSVSVTPRDVVWSSQPIYRSEFQLGESTVFKPIQLYLTQIANCEINRPIRFRIVSVSSEAEIGEFYTTMGELLGVIKKEILFVCKGMGAGTGADASDDQQLGNDSSAVNKAKSNPFYSSAVFQNCRLFGPLSELDSYCDAAGIKLAEEDRVKRWRAKGIVPLGIHAAMEEEKLRLNPQLHKQQPAQQPASDPASQDSSPSPGTPVNGSSE